MEYSEPPHSIDAEQAVLGAILKDSRCIDTVIETIQSPDYFYHPNHKHIYETILNLYKVDDPIDSITIGDVLEQTQTLQESGGRLYLVELIDGVVSLSNISTYCGIVVEKYKLRQLIDICEKIKASAYDTDDSDKILSDAEAGLANLSIDRGDDFESLGIIVNDYIADLLSKRKDRSEEYIPTRIQDLDDAIIGIFKKDMTIIAGPPSMGKSSFALDIGIFASAGNRKTLYFSMDERKTAMIQRIISSGAEIEPRKFYRPQTLTKDEEESLTQVGLAQAVNDNIYLSEETDINVYDIKAKIAKRKRLHGVDCVIIDYIQQLRPLKKFERKDLEVAENSRLLKAIAKELNVAMIVISQLNREYAGLPIDIAKGKYGIPTPNMLRESGSLEQDANVILFVWNVIEALRKRSGGEKEMELAKARFEIIVDDVVLEKSFIVIAKNKVGETKTIECIWNKRQMRFYSESKREY